MPGVATLAAADSRARRDFTLLWTGQAVSELASRGYGVAIMLWALAMTGSPAVVGLTATVSMAAFALSNVPAGWIVDRADRKHTMVYADLCGAVAAAVLALAVAAGHYLLWHVLLTAAVLGAAWCVRSLAEDAALPHVAGHHGLTRAVSLVEGRGYAAGLAGPPLAAALYSVSAMLPFLAQAVSFLTAAGTASRVRTPLRSVAADEQTDAALGDAFRFVWNHTFLRPAAVITALTILVANGAGLVLVVVLTDHGFSAVTVGFALAGAYGAGVAGSVAVPRFQAALPLHGVMRGSLLAGTAGLALMWWGASALPLLAVVGYALVVASQPLWHVTVSARMLALTPDGLRGRVGGAFGLVATVPAVFAPAAAGLLAATVGAAATIIALTGVAMFAVAVAFTSAGLARAS